MAFSDAHAVATALAKLLPELVHEVLKETAVAAWRTNRKDLWGIFFEGRFKSIAVIGEEALLAIGVYIDLNPVAARIAELRKQSDYIRSSSSGPCRDEQNRGRGSRQWRRRRQFASGNRSGKLTLWLC